MKILLKNATIIHAQSPFHNQQKDILIDTGKIVSIEDHIEDQTAKSLQLEQLHVSTGWFDPNVSFGEPGYEERETIANGLATAAKSGFTSIVLNPNTLPLVDSFADVSNLINQGKNHTTQLLVSGMLSEGGLGQQMASLSDMHQAGAVAFGDFKQSLDNPNLLRIALDYLQTFDGLILAYPIDSHLSNHGQMHEGKTSTHLGIRGIPRIAETATLARDLQILEYTGGKLHIPFISCAESVALIAAAKKKRLNVSCGVGIPHLFYTDAVLADFDAVYKINPPLRSNEDRQALREGLLEGTIDMVTSIHQPINIEYKQLEFENALEGSIGLETAFGVLNSIFTLEKTIAFLTRGKKRFGLGESKIEVGAAADLSLFNPKKRFTLQQKQLHSSSKNCMFIDAPLKGISHGAIYHNALTLNHD